MTVALCDKALEVLSKTNDGDQLSPGHLKLLENAVNGFLNEQGIETFNDLYEQVVSGGYAQPWLHGVPHMTVDHEGYIFYKTHKVEHYDSPYDPSSEEQLMELAARCEHVEALGVEVCSGTVIWRWKWFKDFTVDHPWLSFFKKNAGLWEGNNSLVVTVNENLLAHFSNHGDMKFYKGVDHFLTSINSTFPVDEIDYHKFSAAGFGIPKAGQSATFAHIFAPLDGVISVLEKYQVPSDFFDLVASQS